MLPAYEAIQGVDHAYEYALLDEENGRIDYIFLQFVDEDDLVFCQRKTALRLRTGLYGRSEAESLQYVRFPGGGRGV